mgnify:CR=1 FL=1
MVSIDFGAMNAAQKSRKPSIEDRAEVIFPTASELEGIRAHAYEDGFNSGRADAALRVSEDVESLGVMIQNAAATIEQQKRSYFEAVHGALGAILKLLRHDDPVSFARKIERALSYAPSGFEPTICVSQEDHAAMIDLLGSDMGIEPSMVSALPSLARGEFLIKYPGGDIRSTLQTHIEAIEEILKDVNQ